MKNGEAKIQAPQYQLSYCTGYQVMCIGYDRYISNFLTLGPKFSRAAFRALQCTKIFCSKKW